MAFEVTLVPKENIELGVTQKAVFTLSNVTPTIPVPGPVGPQGPPGPQGPQGLPGTGVNSTDDVPEGDLNLYYTEERVEAVIAVTPPAPHTHIPDDIDGFDDRVFDVLAERIIAGNAVTITDNLTEGSILIDVNVPNATGTNNGLLTASDFTKLQGIQSGAEVNVNADWNATSGDAQILNKPNIILKAVASGTDTYTATISNVLAYNDADSYLIRFTNGNTTGATLNINGLGAKTLYKNNDGAIIGGDITSGGEMLCIYNSTLNGFQCIGTAPNSLFAYVTNAETSTINKGQPVYAFGGTGDRLTVKLAYNTGDSTSAQTVGLVWSSSIGANQKGLIIIQGQLDGLNIFPTATWSDGDAVYLGATAGTLTKTKPSAPNHLVYLGFVTTASNGNNGRMYVRVQNGYELQELHNVALSSPPNNNDGLFYETATSLWKNKSIPTVLGYTPENVANKSDSYTVSSSTTYATTKAVVDGLATKLNTSLKGASNGLAELDSGGKVPTSQLPSYVDDVLEYANIGALPATGSAGIIYVTLDDNKIYRWSGTAYTVISDTLALGETSATAHRGDRGKIAYDHSQIITGNPHGTTKADIGLGNVDNTSDANKPVSTATQTALNAKVDANTAITGATKTKITYDSKGLVTSGADATTADIAESTNKLYVSDGDKGDITVSGNGTTWTIDNQVVTFAKMQNVATGTLFGRTDAGSGVAGSITIGTGLTGSASTLTANLSVGVNNGQSVIGGARASENLTLSSTSNATKGKIILGSLSAYDEANDRLGIGTTSPTNTFHISKNITASSGNALIGLVNGTLTASANNDTLNGLNVNLTFSNGAFTGVNNYLQSWSNGGTLRSFVRWDGLQQWDMVNASNVNVGRIQYGYPSNNAGMAIFDWDTTNSVYFNRYNIANEGTFFYQGFHNINNLGGMALFNTTHNLVIGYSGTPTDSGFKLDVNGTARASTSLDTPIVRGSTSASGTLTLSSTSNATKGKIVLGSLSAYDEANDRLGIGTTSPVGNFHIVGQFIHERFANFPQFNFRRSNGTQASPTSVLSGDALGSFSFVGLNSSGAYATASSRIIASSTENFTSTAQGSYIDFETTPNNTITRLARLRIDQDGNILIGTTTNSGFKLDVNGTIRAQGDFTISAKNIITDTTTGTIIATANNQKLAFWNKTPIAQPTTAIAQAAFIQVNTTNAVSDASTFGGYTLRQIAQALINIGILA